MTPDPTPTTKGDGITDDTAAIQAGALTVPGLRLAAPDPTLTDEELATLVEWADAITELGPHLWRQGRKVGRTLYIQRGPSPSDDDQLIGVMDSEYDAEFVVFARNHVPLLIAALRASREEVERLRGFVGQEVGR